VIFLRFICGAGFFFSCAFAMAAGDGQWRLVWSDEFNYEGVPDPNKWGYERGFNRNEEAQWYTEARPENARVEGGYLVIEARKEPWVNPAYSEGSKNWRLSRRYADYTSASLTTRGKAEWTFGRIEARAKFPRGRGVWPAIWTLGSRIETVGYPRCGEIDIAEFFGKDPDQFLMNVHFDFRGKRKSLPKYADVDSLTDTFHVYRIDWSPSGIDFFLDGKLQHSVSFAEYFGSVENPFLAPQYLIINLAMGGKSGGWIDDSVLPAKFLLDYVRVYQKAGQ